MSGNLFSKFFNSVISLFDTEPVGDGFKKQAPFSVSSSKIFEDLTKSQMFKIPNNEDSYIIHIKTSYIVKKSSELYSHQVEKVYLRSNRSGEINLDSKFYEYIRYDSFGIYFPEYVEKLIDLYNIKEGSVFHLKSTGDKIWKVIDVRPVIVSTYNPSLENNKFVKKYSWDNPEYGAIFLMQDIDNERKKKYVFLDDIVLKEVDQERLKFRKEVEEYIEDYFLNLIDSKLVNFKFKLENEYACMIDLNILNEDTNSILSVLETLNSIKKRMESSLNLNFELYDMSKSTVRIKLRKI
jgi:hypothetical protein